MTAHVTDPKWDPKKKRFRIRWVDLEGKPHEQATHLKGQKDQAKLRVAELRTQLNLGKYLNPDRATLTMEAWTAEWLEGYDKKPRTVAQARSHIKHINAFFGKAELRAIKPNAIKIWTAKMKREGAVESTVYSRYSRLSQLLSDAFEEGLIPKNPCSRKTAPPMGKPKAYCATTGQIWAIHDAIEEHFRPAILLGAFVGLRIGEVSGLRVSDIDFMRGRVEPKTQHVDETLKTESSYQSVAIPEELSLLLASYVEKFPSEFMVTDGAGGWCPGWRIERALRKARAKVHKTDKTLPARFSFHDLRHHLASLLINNGKNPKVVQRVMRHDSVVVTMQTYAHVWPDTEDSAAEVVGGLLATHMGMASATKIGQEVGG